MIGEFFLHLIHHNLHGAAELIVIIPVITADKKRNGGCTNDQEGEDTDEYDGAMYL